MTVRNWGGPISAVLKAAREGNETGVVVVSHRGLTLRFARHLAERNAGFQFTRFVMGCGYDRVQAHLWARETFDSLPPNTRRKLKDQERYAYVRGWWRV